MALKTKLFDGKLSKYQALIVGAWYLNLAGVLVLWATTSASLITSGELGSMLIAAGRLLGLLAAFFALTQFMLMGRIMWIERHFGLDHLASYHRFNGYVAIYSILIHIFLVVLGYSISSQTGFFSQYKEIIQTFPYVWLALIGAVLFMVVAVSSAFIVRRKLKFETWYYVHLITYAAITLAFFHQLAVGGSFIESGLARNYWYALYGFVAANLLFWRFGWPTLNLFRFGFKVDRVESETLTTTSVYIKGNHLLRWGAKPGQYALVRFLGKGFVFQEHPFSLSDIVKDNEMRLTVRNVGDYTSKIPNLKPGTRVLTSGPFGRFTSALAITDKRLFIAGGVGITPIRAMLAEAVNNRTPSILLYANRNPKDVVFAKELVALAGPYLKIKPVFSDAPAGYKGETGYINGAMIKRLVPDYAERDVYICGPQPMMDGIATDLTATDLPTEQLHFERFALHN